MALSDGYGEALSLDQVSAMIEENERLLWIKTRDVARRPEDWDDLLNEGRIVQWEVLTKRPDAPREYVSAAMSMRLREAATRGTWTGMPRQQGKPSIDPLRRHDRDSLDDPDLYHDAAAEFDLDPLLMAYHEGEILQAIRALPERHQRYVVQRFWMGLTHAEMAPSIGIKPGNMARMWTESIRPVLGQALAHLREVA